MAKGPSKYRFEDEGSIHKYATLIPNTVVRGLKSRNLSIYAKWLYVYIKSRAGETGICYSSTTTIAEEAGMSRGQVSTAKKELITHGLIMVRTGRNPHRNADNMRVKDIWPANMQEFSVQDMNTDDEWPEGDTQGDTSPSVHNMNTESASVHHMNSVFTIRTECSPHEQLRSIPEEVSQKKETPPPTPQRGKRTRTKASQMPATDYTPGFQRVWSAYPSVRHERKVATFAIWQARTLEPRAAEIAEKLERLTLTLWAGREKRFIPLPTTWFNDARYEDDLVPLEVAQQQEARERMSDREYRNMQAAQRFLENGHAGQRQTPIPDRDAEVIDGIQYRIE